MKNVIQLIIPTKMEELKEWLINSRMDELILLVNAVPQQRFTLSKKGRLIDAAEGDNAVFVIDGEMTIYQEVDGQFEPGFEPIPEVLRLELRNTGDGKIEVQAKVKVMPRLTEKLEENLKGFSSRILQAFSNEK